MERHEINYCKNPGMAAVYARTRTGLRRAPESMREMIAAKLARLVRKYGTKAIDTDLRVNEGFSLETFRSCLD